MKEEEEIVKAFNRFKNGESVETIVQFPLGFYHNSLKETLLPRHGKWVKKRIIDFTSRFEISYVAFVHFLHDFCLVLNNVKHPTERTKQFTEFIENQFSRINFTLKAKEKIDCKDIHIHDIFDSLLPLQELTKCKDFQLVWLIDTYLETGFKKSTIKTRLSEFKKIL